MELRDWVIVFATLMGPILAVQAQKAVEAYQERNRRKLWLFGQLMATRAARASPDHVTALNMIDLVFYGGRFLGIRKRSRREQQVLDSWKEYHDLLSTDVDDAGRPTWIAKQDELFVNLLFSMAGDVGITFDRVQLKKGAYSPIAHGDLLNEQAALRQLTIKTLKGEAPLKMDVVGFPGDRTLAEAQISAMVNLTKAIDHAAERVAVGDSKAGA